MVVGVISDTHGLLRPSAIEILRSCEHIVHAGDIGRPEVLDGLSALAPLSVIRGNVDRDPWADPYPNQLTIKLSGYVIHIAHDRRQLKSTRPTDDVDIVITGHSHKPEIKRETGTSGDVLYFNPGSAGPRRFKLPIALGFLDLSRQQIDARIVELTA
jgi:putative phosphoesterase